MTTVIWDPDAICPECGWIRVKMASTGKWCCLNGAHIDHFKETNEAKSCLREK